MFCKKGGLKKFAKIHRKALASESPFLKKVTLAQISFCEFCETFKNNDFKEHLRNTPSVILQRLKLLLKRFYNFFLFIQVFKKFQEIILDWYKLKIHGFTPSVPSLALHIFRQLLLYLANTACRQQMTARKLATWQML